MGKAGEPREMVTLQELAVSNAYEIAAFKTPRAPGGPTLRMLTSNTNLLVLVSAAPAISSRPLSLPPGALMQVSAKNEQPPGPTVRCISREAFGSTGSPHLPAATLRPGSPWQKCSCPGLDRNS